MPVVTISQPRYLPACNYIQRMVLSDIFVYLDSVKYSPRDWENRNKVKLSNGEPAWLSVPVIHESRDQLIRDTRIDNGTDWGYKHLNTFKHNYSKAKYFDRYIGFFEDAFNQTWEYLEDLNLYIIDFIVKQLGITCRFLKSSELEAGGKGQELLINICREVGGDIYLSGPMGNNYIDDGAFEANNLKLVYHDYKYPVYPQMHGEFMPWMSFVDLLFNCGDDSSYYLNKDNVSREDILKA